jgi:oligopeptide transport system substrate-binding protein
MDNPGKNDLPAFLKAWSRRDFLARAGQGAAALALSGGAGALLDACGGTGGGGGGMAKDQTLRIYLNTEPGTLDPNQQQWNYEGEVGRNMFETLLRPKLDLSDVQPAAAASLPQVSSDGKTWTFKLRQDGKWSDGKPVTAQDFLYGFQRILNPAVAAAYADPFFDGTIKGGENYNKVDPKDAGALQQYLQSLGLHAPDDHTFVIELQGPAPFFKWVVSLWIAAPVRKDVVGADPANAGWANDPKTAVSNGWFKLSEYQPKDHVTLVPNSYYWGTKPKIQKLVQQIIVDESKAYASYQNGELEVATVPLPETASNANNPELVKEPQLTVYWISLNTLAPPFNNKMLRQAIAKAIDRDKFVKDVYHGRGLATGTFIPKGMNGYNPSLGSYQKFDVTEAKRLLDASGVSKADINQITMDYRNNTPDNKTMAEYLVNQLNTNLGLSIQANPVDSKTLSGNLKKGNFKMMALAGWGADYPDQQDWFDTATTPPSTTARGNNFEGYSNQAYDKLVQQADVEADESKRARAYDQAHKMLCDDAPRVYIYQRTGWALVKKYVKGLTSVSIDDYPFVGDMDTPSIYIESH